MRAASSRSKFFSHSFLVPIALTICIFDSIYAYNKYSQNEFLIDQLHSADELYQIALDDNTKLSVENYELRKMCGIPQENEDDSPQEESTPIQKPKYMLIKTAHVAKQHGVIYTIHN